MNNSEELKWQTGITKIEPNKILLRGYPLDKLMGTITFSQAVYLALKGELPEEKIGKMIDAMLVASIDHGATPPSALAARTVASTGAPLNAALATGILSINKFHGGAIEDCMKALKQGLLKAQNENLSVQDAAVKLLLEFKEKKVKISGYGHRIHTNDPRTRKLFALSKELGVAKDYVAMAEAIEEATAVTMSKKLPLNVDGAIGAILGDLGFEPEIANAFFIMARVPGLVAHIREEMTQMKPMRKIHPSLHEYSGHEERDLIN